MKIKMFTKTICGSCKTAKQKLSFLPVPVEIEEINIETDEPFYDFEGNLVELKVEYMTEKLDSMSTPTFEFEDGSVVRGFEMGLIMEKVGL
ncbi:glutaredoxin family protein [Bacillus anthracis]